MPAVFLVITATVAVYGLSARPLALRLKLSVADPQGVVIAGASPLARVIAKGLKDAGFAVLLVDRNWRNFTTARMNGIEAYYGDTLSEDTIENINLTDKGKFLALTPNDRINTLSALHFQDVFESDQIFQLAAEKLDTRDDDPGMPRHLMGRELFGEKITYGALADRVNRGAELKVTKLSKEFTFDDFREEHGNDAVPLFVVTTEDKLVPITKTDSVKPAAGAKLISLVALSSADTEKPREKS